jgi:hypothetical protein
MKRAQDLGIGSMIKRKETRDREQETERSRQEA